MPAELSQWLHAQFPSVRDLTPGELSRYESKDPICGWVVPFEHQDDRFGLQWENETTRKQPHCGASFQPYGPVSLSGVAALVAKTATKSLVGEVLPGTEAVCWDPQEEISEQGGRYNPNFLNSFSALPEFGGSRQFEWGQRDGCPFCEEA